eukprot:6293317-Alexandrium_andersonii.AAC.1
MSASLVGSEMCIRDSGCTMGWPTSIRASRVPALLQRSAAPALRSRPAAVSYTHLTLPTICSV